MNRHLHLMDNLTMSGKLATAAFAHKNCTPQEAERVMMCRGPSLEEISERPGCRFPVVVWMTAEEIEAKEGP